MVVQTEPQRVPSSSRIFLALSLAILLMVIGALIAGQPGFAILAVVVGVAVWVRGRESRT